MLLGKFTRFNFVKKLKRSHNFTFIIQDNFWGGLWLAKIFRTLERNPRHFSDLNHRSLLAYRLAKLVGSPVPETHLIDPRQIKFTLPFGNYLYYIHPDEVVRQDKILVTKFQGISLASFLKISKVDDITNLRQILEDLVFNLWIGNYDKKDLDYVVTDRNYCYSIDNTLLGPGFENNKTAIGAYSEPFDLNRPEDTGWTIGESFLEFIKQKQYGTDFFKPAIAGIQQLSTEKIKASFKDLNFFRFRSPENINNIFMDFLLERKRELPGVIDEWVSHQYPRAVLPRK